MTDHGHTPSRAELADLFGLNEERDSPGLSYSRHDAGSDGPGCHSLPPSSDLSTIPAAVVPPTPCEAVTDPRDLTVTWPGDVTPAAIAAVAIAVAELFATIATDPRDLYRFDLCADACWTEEET